MQRVESFGKDLVEGQKSRRIIPLQECIHKEETIFIVKYVQITQNVLIFDICATECDRLIEDRQGITHCAICLMSYHMKRLVVDRNGLAGSYHTKISYDILDSDPVEIVCLTT